LNMKSWKPWYCLRHIRNRCRPCSPVSYEVPTWIHRDKASDGMTWCRLNKLAMKRCERISWMRHTNLWRWNCRCGFWTVAHRITATYKPMKIDSSVNFQQPSKER
jgi:hypothetical protein